MRTGPATPLRAPVRGTSPVQLEALGRAIDGTEGTEGTAIDRRGPTRPVADGPDPSAERALLTACAVCTGSSLTLAWYERPRKVPEPDPTGGCDSGD